jgi:hypothetical protein
MESREGDGKHRRRWKAGLFNSLTSSGKNVIVSLYHYIELNKALGGKKQNLK